MSVKTPDLAPYQILGVSPKASQSEITAAYKVLAHIFHPDRFADSPQKVREEAETRMRTLNDAYKCAKQGYLLAWPGKIGGNGGPRSNQSQWEARSPGAETFLGTPWAQANRDRAAMARDTEARRRARERSSKNGNAVMRARTRERSCLTGLGLAEHTNNIHCRGCQSIQWLPPGWKKSLDHSVFYCSFCNRLLLSR